MKSLLIVLIALSVGSLHSQDIPVWDIGTKWIYEVLHSEGTVSFVTNEIVDTVTIENLKLYVVYSNPFDTEIKYFYYQDKKVYSYIEDEKFLQLLYDFENSNDYMTNYQPICSAYFDYDSLTYGSYTVSIDSSDTYGMPDGSMRSINYASITDTIITVNDTLIDLEAKRTILDGIGFITGGQTHTHDWEFGRHFCDAWRYTITDIRCFESSTSSYNFKNYPCDTLWTLTNTEELSLKESTFLYPNPSNGIITLETEDQNISYRVLNSEGRLLQSGTAKNKQIELINPGINIIQLHTQEGWRSYTIVNMQSSR